jgi:hypothetical protein
MDSYNIVIKKKAELCRSAYRTRTLPFGPAVSQYALGHLMLAQTGAQPCQVRHQPAVGQGSWLCTYCMRKTGLLACVRLSVTVGVLSSLLNSTFVFFWSRSHETKYKKGFHFKSNLKNQIKFTVLRMPPVPAAGLTQTGRRYIYFPSN